MHFQTDPSDSRNEAAVAPCCVPLLKLFDGHWGTVHLGRVTEGDDAGRLVLLRQLEAPQAAAVAAEIEGIRAIAHPQLMKILSLGRAEAHFYLVSEYMPGLALSELRSGLRKQRAALVPAVAIRIVLSALRASLVARQRLRQVAGLDIDSAFHPDSIWLAEFGEVLALPLPGGGLSSGKTPYSSSASNTPVGLLIELATGLTPVKVLGQGLGNHLPEPLARVVAGALANHVSAEHDSETAMVEALEGLPPELLASEREISEELERVVGPRLRSRRLLVAGQSAYDNRASDDATVIARLSVVETKPAANEPTHVYRSSVGRDSDGYDETELLGSGPYSASIELEPRLATLSRIPITPPQVWAAGLLESTSPRAEDALDDRALESAPRTRRLPYALILVLITAALVATVIAYAKR